MKGGDSTIKAQSVTMSTIMSILDKFEAKALQSIEIDARINCDNYDSVSRLKMVNNIRKAIIAAYRNPPQHPRYTLENLLSKGRINL
jgi:hypothetical protein